MYGKSRKTNKKIRIMSLTHMISTNLILEAPSLNHLHLALPSNSFFQRSNCSLNLTMWIEMAL